MAIEHLTSEGAADCLYLYMTIQQFFLVGIGGFAGSVMRFAVSRIAQPGNLLTFPYATLIVNVTGCLLIGIVYGFTLKDDHPSNWRVFLTSGFCGGYTTFSAFAYENIILIENKLWSTAFLYMALSISLGCIAVLAGMIAGKAVRG